MSEKDNINKSSGFTLIELLVVISIISLLSSVVLVSLIRTRVQARNTVRIQHMHQIIKALELYYNANGKYPDSIEPLDCPTAPGGWDASYITSTPNPNKFLNVLVVDGYLSRSPLDPLDGKATGCVWPNAWIYMYFRFVPGTGYWDVAWDQPNSKCKTAFYVLIVGRFEGMLYHPDSPKFTCGVTSASASHNFDTSYVWVAGSME